MAKYDYILKNGTSIIDTDEEKKSDEYILKTVHSTITTTTHLTDEEILSTIIARGKNPVGGVDSAQNFPLDYDLTQYPLYRHRRGDGTSGQVLDTSGFDNAYAGFGTYLASSLMLDISSGKVPVLDISIQKVLLDVSLDTISVGSGTAIQPKVNHFYMAYDNDDFKTASHEFDMRAGFLGRYAEDSTSPLKYSLSSINEFRTGLKVYWDSNVVVPLGVSGINHSYVSEYNINGYGHATALPQYALYGGNTFPRESFNETVGNILFRYSTDGYTSIFYITTEDDALFLIACLGFAFQYNGTIYKPIVNGGIVTGYTDDLDSKSEWDNWSNIGDHKLPDSPDHPIYPETDNDGIDDMKLGFTGYENGFVNYYICTAGNIANLVGEMSSQTNYPNLMGNIVSLKSYACTLNGMYAGNITPIKVGQFQSNTSAIKITTTTYSKQIASFNISGAHGTLTNPHFLDYAPYTKLEVYIPFCGTVPLPPECMYNTVTVHIVTDITSGSCTGVVKCNGNIVAQKSGIIGTTIPLSINDSASQNNAFNQGMLNTAQKGVGAIVNGGTGNIAGAAGNLLGALGSALNTVQTMNDNYTRVIGTQGDKSAYAMPKNCYLKRYRTIDLSDAEYTATIGRPVCKRKLLSSGDGFTVCDNPQVYGSMTLAEKNEIEQFMRNGIIL